MVSHCSTITTCICVVPQAQAIAQSMGGNAALVAALQVGSAQGLPLTCEWHLRELCRSNRGCLVDCAALSWQGHIPFPCSLLTDGAAAQRGARHHDRFSMMSMTWGCRDNVLYHRVFSGKSSCTGHHVMSGQPALLPPAPRRVALGSPSPSACSALLTCCLCGNAAQQGLAKMAGASSGFIESLPPRMRARIAFLESLQDKHDELEEKFDEEMLALEKKYEALYGEDTPQCAAAALVAACV